MIVQISDDLFWGFKVLYESKDRNDITDEEIITYVTCMLEYELVNLGLQMLVEQLKKKKFHIHQRDENNITYVCSHKH